MPVVGETPWLEGLNPSQRHAVTHGDGPLLVVAGAGTGKTRTLASRVAFLLDGGVAPERILLLTFTRRAAAEMLHRAGQLIGQDGAKQVWGGTFHAVGNRLLRMYARAVDLPEDFTILEQSDAADLISMIRTELGVAKSDRRFPRKATLLGIYSRMVNAQESLSETLATHFPWCRDDADAISKARDKLMQDAQAIGRIIYEEVAKQASAGSAAEVPLGEADSGAEPKNSGVAKDENVIDAEFEVKDAK